MSIQAQRGMSADCKQGIRTDIFVRAVTLAYNPQAEYHVHYSILDTSAPGATESPQRRGVARLVELIRAKGNKMKRDRKTQ